MINEKLPDYNLLSQIIYLIFCLFPFSIIAQNPSDCFDISPFCSDENHEFPNAIGTSAPYGPDYGCLSQTPNPIWYYIKIGESGDFLLSLEQTNINGEPIDVDFALWGPFSELNSGCEDIMNGAVAPIQCSYSNNTSEIIGLGQTGGSNDYGNGESTPPNGESSEYYILLLTNFSGEQGSLSIDQIGGSGTTDCSILLPCTIEDFTIDERVCNEDSNTFSMYGTIHVNDPPEEGLLIIEDCQGNSVTLFPPFNSPINFEILNLPANGIDCDLTAYFTEATDCKEIIEYVSPPSCICDLPEVEITDIITCSAIQVNLEDGVNYPSGYSVSTTYYTSETNANNAQNGISHFVSVGGTYWIRVTDLYNPDCYIVLPIEVEINNLSYTDNRILPTCLNNDGEILLYPEGGTEPYTFQLDENTQENNSFDELYAGLYTFTITDANGCELTDTIILNNENAPIIDSVYLESPICVTSCNGLIEVFPSLGLPPYSYAWYDEDIELIEGEETNSLENICGNANLIFIVEITDANGCILYEMKALPSPIYEDPYFVFPNFCVGNSPEATNIATPGGTFSIIYPLGDGATINETTGEISNEVPGTAYSVKHETSGSCPQSMIRQVKVYESIDYSIEITHPVCNNIEGNILVEPQNQNSGYHYSINGGDYIDTNAFHHLSGGNYIVSIKDTNGCVVTENIVLNEPFDPKLEITSINVNLPVCHNDCDGNIEVTVEGGYPPYQIFWYDNNSVLFANDVESVYDLCPDNYSVEIEDQNNCVVSSKITIQNPNRKDATFYFDDFCENEAGNHFPRDIENEGGIFQLIAEIPEGTTIDSLTGELMNAKGGKQYWITYTTPEPCSETDTIMVNVFEQPVVDFSANPLIGTPPLNVEITNLSEDVIYDKWYFGDGTQNQNMPIEFTHSYNDFGEYDLILIGETEYGCMDTSSVKIEVIFEPLDYNFPNVFSPNGDAQNDVFKLIDYKNIIAFEIVVLNRWGNIVYESQDLDFQWNGRIRNEGELCNNGVYFYKAVLTDLHGEQFVVNGFVHLF